MHIEFFLPSGKDVKLWTVEFVKNKLLEFYQTGKEISSATVHFKVGEDEAGGDKICEITLGIFGADVFIRRNERSFDAAARLAVNALAANIKAQLKRHKNPPEEIVTTVKA